MLSVFAVPAGLVLAIILFIVAICVLAVFFISAMNTKANKEIAEQPEEKKEHAEEGLEEKEDIPKEEEDLG